MLHKVKNNFYKKGCNILKKTKNPFSYTRTVIDKAFCNRKKEQADLLDFIENSQNILLYSHRRHGKTSLTNQVFKNIERKKIKIGKIIIDLYGTLTERDFVSAVFDNLNQIESKTDKLIELTTKLLKSLKIKYSYDPISHDMSISTDFDATDPKELLESVMKILESYSQKKKLVVVFDEFQEVAKYAGVEFEKRLRTIIQRHENICYIFSGSQSHILSLMFNSKGRAFYKQAQSYPLGKISLNDYIEWSKNLFAEKEILFPEKIIEEIVCRCENHPMYVQQFLYFLWKRLNLKITVEHINIVEKEIIEFNQNEYINLWDSLTQNQKKTLKLIAINDGKDLFNAGSLEKMGLKNPSVISRAIKSLREKEIISKNDKYHIQDIVFKKWIISF